MQVCSQRALASSKKTSSVIISAGSPTALINSKGGIQMDKNSLAHTTWECKYHIVFAPKFRRKVIYQQIRADVGHILSELCKRKGIEIIEAEACPDHIHMLVRIPPKYSVSEIMGYLKGKSSLMIFDRHSNLKYKYGSRHFWCRGYYVDTVGKNAKKIEEYIRNQLQEDLEYDQMSLKEYIDPFTGEQVKKGK
jgi:REP element-mobilizing transposase RayT